MQKSIFGEKHTFRAKKQFINLRRRRTYPPVSTYLLLPITSTKTVSFRICFLSDPV